jgi:hypothetical protein
LSITTIDHKGVNFTPSSQKFNTSERDLTSDLEALAREYDPRGDKRDHIAFALALQAIADTYFGGDHAQAHTTFNDYLNERDDVRNIESALLTHWRWMTSAVTP